MKFLSIEEYNQLPKCPSCNSVEPTLVLETHGYCMNCAIAKGQMYCDTEGIPQGIAIVCTRCGAQNPSFTRYGNEFQVFCSNCSPLEPEEE